jgi:hypothetical protein
VKPVARSRRVRPAKTARPVRRTSYRFSVEVRAPLAYAYEWCTDYRESDHRFTSTHPTIAVPLRDEFRVIRTFQPKVRSGRPAPMTVEVITLLPPDRWHLEQYSEDDDSTVDYRLTRLGPRKTRIDFEIREKWRIPQIPTRKEYLAGWEAFWSRAATALGEGYGEGRSADR